MSETIAHTNLVAVIVHWMRATYSEAAGFYMLCDSPTVVESEKPPPIDGFYPDVYATASLRTVTVLGEAKTLPDLESKRSFYQLTRRGLRPSEM